jgi:hypothetical protein
LPAGRSATSRTHIYLCISADRQMRHGRGYVRDAPRRRDSR